MDIKHRISINSKKDADLMSVVNKFEIPHRSIELPGGDSSLVTFIIEETDQYWPIIDKLVTTKGAVDMVDTYFSDEEVRNAEWSRLISTFEQGYPQPKLNWPLKQFSYDLTCPKCAIYKQIAPMRLAKEPNLGRKSFMSLIWAGEIFCTPEVILGLERIHARGYEVWDAVIHKTGKQSEKVHQLYISGVALPGVVVDDALERKICPECGITKYSPHVKGKMCLKRESLLSDTDFMLTHEWFGHGLLAWREILVSNRVASLINEKGWQGVRFKVVEIV